MRRHFSLVMKSRKDLDKICIREGDNGVLLEGNLGEIDTIKMLENQLLEIKCSNGVWRFDVRRDELLKVLIVKREPSAPS